MPGTLVISTLSDGTTSTSATNAIIGSAKAWVNFNGVTTATIRASYNVSSVTRNSTGNYTVNFTNAMSDANYCVTLMAWASAALIQGSKGSATSLSASNVVVQSAGNSGVADADTYCVAILR